VISQGFSAIIDAAFLREAERDALAAGARTMAADFRPIFLDADFSVRVSRIASRRRDASDATAEIASRQESYDIGRLDWPVVDVSSSPEQTREKSLILLG